MRLYKGVKIPVTIDHWQLYDIEGGRKCAERLNEAVRRAFDRMDDLISKGESVLDARSKAMEVLEEVMVRESKWGACDSEPYWAAFGALRRYSAKRMGVDLDRLSLLLD